MIVSVLLKALTGVLVGLAGALGPWWLYARSQAHVAKVEAQLTAARAELDISGAELAQVSESLQAQNEGISRLRFESSMLQSRIEKAKAENEKLAVQNMGTLAALAQARVPRDAEGAMEWQKNELIQLSETLK